MYMQTDMLAGLPAQTCLHAYTPALYAIGSSPLRGMNTDMLAYILSSRDTSMRCRRTGGLGFRAKLFGQENGLRTGPTLFLPIHSDLILSDLI